MSDGKSDGGTEQFIGWAMILVVIGIVLYIFYTMYTPQVLSFVRWVRFGEMWLVSLLTPDSYMVTLVTGDKVNLREWLDGVSKIPADKIDIELVRAMSAVAMTPYKYMIIAILAVMAFWAYTKGPGTQYVEKFNLFGFIKHQAKAFKIISPFVRFNPSDQPPRAPGSPVPAELPLFAEALGPEEWLAYNEIPAPDEKLNEGKIFNAFAQQLGPRWRGVKYLKPHHQVLLAAFCLKAARKRDASDEILARIASCWSHDKGLQLSKDSTLLKEARKILNNKDIAHSVLKKCNQHGWQTTALLRALATAREEGGVLAPATFVWLRGYDRALWYPLNNLGRQSNHIEAIGAMAHYRIEKRAKRPIPKPKVQDAVTSIIDYMADGNARPIPALDYSYSKNKRGIKKLKNA